MAHLLDLLGGGGSVIQNSEDKIIFNLVNGLLGLDVVAPNVSISGYEATNHAFLDTYMAGSSAQIVSEISATKNSLTQPEIDPDCDIRVAEINTLNARDVTDTSATLRGRLTSGAGVHAWLVFDENSSNVFCDPLLHNGSGSYDAETIINRAISNLEPNTTYYARSCAKGLVGGVRDGGLITFITERNNGPASITTSNAREVLFDRAKLVGNLTEGDDVIIWVNYGPSVNNTIASCKLSDYNKFINQGSTKHDAFYASTINANNLVSETTYQFRFCAHNGVGVISDGGIKFFTTPRALQL